MVTELKAERKTLYDMDYNLWVLETVKQLKDKNFNALDLDNLIEEVEDFSKRDKRKLKSLLIKLIEHLLKLGYWQSEKDNNQRHWLGEIRIFRQQIIDQLEDSPSLKNYLSDIFEECYHKGRAVAVDRSGLPLSIFPENPIAPLEQILDINWLP